MSYPGNVVVSAGPAISTGTWYHIACVVTGSKVYIYRNGSLITNGAAAQRNRSTVVRVLQGANYGATAYANAHVDDPMIFGAALSADDILDIYNGTKSRYV